MNKIKLSPLIMGILNVTPDSFSDGGKYNLLDSALIRAEEMIKEGVDIIDIGGESTRPGAAPVTLAQERDRVLPILKAIREKFPVRLSIDTSKYEMAEEAVDLGATLINDISGGRDIRLATLLQKNPTIEIVLMHMQGSPHTMQESPCYRDGVVSEVGKYLRERVRAFREYGIEKSRLWIDPGFGFGKTVHHNLDLLRHLESFEECGGRLLVGTSRKRFLSYVVGQENAPMEWRSAGTLATNLWAYEKGASVFRVHEVGHLKRALATWEAVKSGMY